MCCDEVCLYTACCPAIHTTAVLGNHETGSYYNTTQFLKVLDVKKHDGHGSLVIVLFDTQCSNILRLLLLPFKPKLFFSACFQLFSPSVQGTSQICRSVVVGSSDRPAVWPKIFAEKHEEERVS